MAPISRVAGLCNSLSRCITDAVKFAGDDRRFVKQDRRPVILLTHPTLSDFDLQDTQLARTQPPLRTPSSLRGSHYMLRHSVAAAGDAAAIRRRMRRFAQRHPTAPAHLIGLSPRWPITSCRFDDPALCSRHFRRRLSRNTATHDDRHHQRRHRQRSRQQCERR